MPTRRTPWANTLRTACPIFIHDPVNGKLSQVAGYAVGVAGLGNESGPLVFEAGKPSPGEAP
jgi:hypothetical protein